MRVSNIQRVLRIRAARTSSRYASRNCLQAFRAKSRLLGRLFVVRLGWCGAADHSGAVVESPTEGTFTGADLLSPGNGNQFSTLTNGDVNFAGAFDTVILGSGTNSLEIDNISAVPEPATWAMMILGFMAVGLRHDQRNRLSDQGIIPSKPKFTRRINRSF
jgi:hypothetical protein